MLKSLFGENKQFMTTVLDLFNCEYKKRTSRLKTDLYADLLPLIQASMTLSGYNVDRSFFEKLANQLKR